MVNLEFYAVCLPGLEDIVEAEIKNWFPTFETKAEHGGITVMAPLAPGLSMNQVLKTPTRILLRVARFTCRDFPKLYNKIADITWADLIDMNCTMEVHASATRSRLKIKTRIEETCKDAWATAQRTSGVKKPKEKIPPAQRPGQLDLYVRLMDNLCTLSLDTSGERLHKRGSRQLIGEAPLRESLAAALVQVMRRHSTDPSPVELVDPMMGSGTFLLESLVNHQVVREREFAFQNFTTQADPVSDQAQPQPVIDSVIGFEVDSKTFKTARENLKPVKAKTQLFAVDFFTAQKLPGPKRRWLIANPPWGERLKIKEPLNEYYAKLFLACERVARPELSCFLLPAKSGRLELPHNWKVLEKRRLSNGGISVIAYVFQRSGPLA